MWVGSTQASWPSCIALNLLVEEELVVNKLITSR